MAYLTGCEYCGRLGCHGFVHGKYTCIDCTRFIADITSQGRSIDPEEVKAAVNKSRQAELDAAFERYFGCPPPKIVFKPIDSK